MTEDLEFDGIARRFKSNIDTLLVFNNQIGGFADDHDTQSMEEFTRSFFELFELNDLEAEYSTPGKGHTVSESDSIETSSVDSNLPNSLDVNQDVEDTLKNDNGIKPKIKKQLENPEFRRQLMSITRQFRHSSPRQGYLLRRSALVTLVSYFETLLSDLIQSYYTRYPAALPSDDRVLSLADIRAIGSIEDAERYLTIKEAENIIRKKTQDQLEYFARRFKIDLKPISAHVDDLVEIVQRRNLFVHNDGIVNRTYLTFVQSDFIDKNSINDGDRLPITKTYVAESIDTVLVVGIKLIQKCWRKWDKDNRQQADDVLLDDVYQSLVDEEYELTVHFAEFGSTIDISKDRISRAITINHAIALKELEKPEVMEGIISILDWSSCSPKFILALHILRDEDAKIYELLPLAIAAGEIKRFEMEQWPLFRPIRSDPRFIEILEHHFPDK